MAATRVEHWSPGQASEWLGVSPMASPLELVAQQWLGKPLSKVVLHMRGITDITKSEIQWRVPSLTNTVACVLSMLTCITWQCCPASQAGLQFKLPVHHVLPYVCLSCHHVSLTCVSSVFHWQHILDICIDVIDIGIGFALH